LRRLKDFKNFGALALASPRALRDGGAQLLAGVYLAAAISGFIENNVSRKPRFAACGLPL
jgi:hypothetical protein